MLWNDPVEVKQAIELLQLWVEIDIEDALEILGPEFENRNVRAFAVGQLKRADDEVSILFTGTIFNDSLFRNLHYIFFNWFKRLNSKG